MFGNTSIVSQGRNLGRRDIHPPSQMPATKHSSHTFGFRCLALSSLLACALFLLGLLFPPHDGSYVAPPRYYLVRGALAQSYYEDVPPAAGGEEDDENDGPTVYYYDSSSEISSTERDGDNSTLATVPTTPTPCTPFDWTVPGGAQAFFPAVRIGNIGAAEVARGLVRVVCFSSTASAVRKTPATGRPHATQYLEVGFSYPSYTSITTVLGILEWTDEDCARLTLPSVSVPTATATATVEVLDASSLGYCPAMLPGPLPIIIASIVAVPQVTAAEDVNHTQIAFNAEAERSNAALALQRAQSNRTFDYSAALPIVGLFELQALGAAARARCAPSRLQATFGNMRMVAPLALWEGSSGNTSFEHSSNSEYEGAVVGTAVIVGVIGVLVLLVGLVGGRLCGLGGAGNPQREWLLGTSQRGVLGLAAVFSGLWWHALLAVLPGVLFAAFQLVVVDETVISSVDIAFHYAPDGTIVATSERSLLDSGRAFPFGIGISAIVVCAPLCLAVPLMVRGFVTRAIVPVVHHGTRKGNLDDSTTNSTDGPNSTAARRGHFSRGGSRSHAAAGSMSEVTMGDPQATACSPSPLPVSSLAGEGDLPCAGGGAVAASEPLPHTVCAAEDDSSDDTLSALGDGRVSITACADVLAAWLYPSVAMLPHSNRRLFGPVAAWRVPSVLLSAHPFVPSLVVGIVAGVPDSIAVSACVGVHTILAVLFLALCVLTLVVRPYRTRCENAASLLLMLLTAVEMWLCAMLSALGESEEDTPTAGAHDGRRDAVIRWLWALYAAHAVLTVLGRIVLPLLIMLREEDWLADVGYVSPLPAGAVSDGPPRSHYPNPLLQLPSASGAGGLATANNVSSETNEGTVAESCVVAVVGGDGPAFHHDAPSSSSFFASSWNGLCAALFPSVVGCTMPVVCMVLSVTEKERRDAAPHSAGRHCDEGHQSVDGNALEAERLRQAAAERAAAALAAAAEAELLRRAAAEAALEAERQRVAECQRAEADAAAAALLRQQQEEEAALALAEAERQRRQEEEERRKRASEALRAEPSDAVKEQDAAPPMVSPSQHNDALAAEIERLRRGSLFGTSGAEMSFQDHLQMARAAMNNWEGGRSASLSVISHRRPTELELHADPYEPIRCTALRCDSNECTVM